MKSLLKALIALLIILTCKQATSQTMGGIGAMLQLDTAKDGSTLPRIKSVVANSPAAAQNLPEGSYIIKVNDLLCKDKTLEEVVAVIRGAVGSTVTLSLADNAQGKKAKDYSLVRAAIQVVPPPDPLEGFYADCAKEVQQLKKKGSYIAKNASSDCGDYFFSFEGGNNLFHVKAMVLETKAASKDIGATASVYDTNDETTTVQLKPAGIHDLGNMQITSLEGTITMKPNRAGVVKTKFSSTAGCSGMYIIVYR